MKMSNLSKFHILGIIYVIFNFDLWYHWGDNGLKIRTSFKHEDLYLHVSKHFFQKTQQHGG